MAQPENQPPELGIAFDLNRSVGEAIGACGGDLLATVRALVVANHYLTAENTRLTADLDRVWAYVSPGYARSTRKRRTKTGERDGTEGA